ncbi:MAG: helix-turn-helix domain-containing protein [Opitutae bacterium]|nr:helix-turn-helix domain-containing protein [Opitutae bacterium]
MQTIGERLEEARKRKGISIREAAEFTKIRGDYLQKFEANSFEVDLPPLYIRGFLRSYARYLDLDPDRVVSDYDTLLGREGRPARRESREPYGRVDFGESGRGPDSGLAAPAGRSDQDQALMLKYGLLAGAAVVALVVIILLINVLFTRTPARPAQTAQGSAPQVVQPVQTREATFTITVIEPTRVKVAYLDNSAIFLDGKFPLNRGEVKSIRYTKDLIVTIEHPDRIKTELNGRAVDVPTNKPMTQFRVPYEPPQ